MDLHLTGHRVLVTGASKGIGLEIVRAYLAEGAHVVAAARRSTPELDATDAEFVAADLAITHGPRDLVAAVLDRDPRLDILVNNAGGGDPDRRSSRTSSTARNRTGRTFSRSRCTPRCARPGPRSRR